MPYRKSKFTEEERGDRNKKYCKNIEIQSKNNQMQNLSVNNMNVLR